MFTFRTIDRKHLITRRAEAEACLHYRLHHSAALTACSGVELLLEFLVRELHDSLLHRSKRRSNSLIRDVKNEERRNNAKIIYWGLGSWVDFYKRTRLFDLLIREFDFTLTTLNEKTLSDVNEVWNKCKHDPYLATPETAYETVNLLNGYLQETEIRSETNSKIHETLGVLSAHWLGQWEKPLAQWISENTDAPATTLLMYLAPLLDLVIRLIDDSRIHFDQKTALVVAANYVFSSLDLIPEDLESGEFSGLVDDGAVLALTLYWLLRLSNIDNKVVYSHWPGGDSILDETNDLKQHIWDKQAVLFPESRRQIGYKLVWKAIQRIAVDGPEALWQNYWQEQYKSESERP